MKNNSIDWSVLFCSTITGVIAQLALKRAVNGLSFDPAAHGMAREIARVLGSSYSWIYGLAAVGSAVTWWWVVKKFELGFAFPVVQSLGFVLVLLASAWLFAEPISWSRWIGILLICAGLFLCK